MIARTAQTVAGGLISALAAVQLVPLHMVDGRTVDINPKTVTRLQEPRDPSHPAAQGPAEGLCIVWFVDHTYLSVVETCSVVRDLIEGK